MFEYFYSTALLVIRQKKFNDSPLISHWKDLSVAVLGFLLLHLEHCACDGGEASGSCWSKLGFSNPEIQVGLSMRIDGSILFSLRQPACNLVSFKTPSISS